MIYSKPSNVLLFKHGDKLDIDIENDFYKMIDKIYRSGIKEGKKHNENNKQNK